MTLGGIFPLYKVGEETAHVGAELKAVAATCGNEESVVPKTSQEKVVVGSGRIETGVLVSDIGVGDAESPSCHVAD
jgi:hypothetical protein